jgi:hypothetical protein
MVRFLFFCAGLLFWFSCEEEPVVEGPCGDKVFIRMFVRDTLDKPRYFKDSQTYLNDTTLILAYKDLDRPSALVVITDDEIDKLKDGINRLTVRAYDFKDSLLLVVPYEVTRDSCHVQYVSGPLKVVIR